MQTKIEIENRKEGELIRRGLEDPATRAFVKIMGVLLNLPNDRARTRIMNYVADQVADEAAA